MTLVPRNSYVEPDTTYDDKLKLTDEYIASLPDLADGPIKGSQVRIPHVGIHNFHLPLKIKTRDGGFIMCKASVTGTVSLEAQSKGINMSRIIRTFYEHGEEVFSLKYMEEVLQNIRRNSGSFDATMKVHFSYPIKQEALRTEGLAGWQYYDVGFHIYVQEMPISQHVVHTLINHVIEFDFVYSSACPCSYELAEHARQYRNKAVVSHSQRSVARVSLLLDDTKPHIWLEEIQELCLQALHTETQVMVKRGDEQAFAELNGSNTKFVEDAARQLYQVFDNRRDIHDFRIVCTHLESLHSHDAVACITKEEGEFFSDDIDYYELRSMVK
jgi:GTP cyclohydrolase I